MAITPAVKSSVQLREYMCTGCGKHSVQAFTQIDDEGQPMFPQVLCDYCCAEDDANITPEELFNLPVQGGWKN